MHASGLLQNSIVWNNAITGSQAITGIIKNCIIQGATPNPTLGITATNPLFANPSDFTNAPFTEDNYDYHFTSASTALNIGDNTAVNTLYNQDLDGLARIQAGTVDLGCYESGFIATENNTNSPKTGISYYNHSIFIDENANMIGKTANIYTTDGKLVQTIANLKPQNTIENLIAGVYFITIIENGSRAVQKIVVLH